MPSRDAVSGELEKSIEICGVQFNAITEAECVHHVVREAQAGRGGWVVTPNVDILRQCVVDGSIAEMVSRASVVVADGAPLIWASRLRGTPLPERVAGSDLISSISAEAAAKGAGVFLLGGDPGTAESAAEVLRQRFPTLHIAGTFYPEFGFEKDPTQIAEVCAALRNAGSEIVFVALSFPKGERLVEAIRDEFPKLWWIGVGISFSFLSGEVKRAPRWLQRLGLEWLYRLSREPRKLLKRYVVHDVPFALRLMVQSLLSRSSRKG